MLDKPGVNEVADGPAMTCSALAGSESPTLAWLYTVARRRFTDELRRQAVARRAGMEETAPTSQTEIDL